MELCLFRTTLDALVTKTKGIKTRKIEIFVKSHRRIISLPA